MAGIQLATKGDDLYFQVMPCKVEEKKPPPTKTINLQKLQNDSQAGGRGGGGKLRKFIEPSDVKSVDGAQPKGASAM